MKERGSEAEMNQLDEKGIAEAVRKALAETGYGGKTSSMTLRLAEELAARVEEKAREWGMRVVTAVADVAVNKAYTCVAFQMSTERLSELARPDGPLYGIQHTNGGRIVIFGGGEPLVVEGKLIGALGVSGGTAEQDTALAAFGASLLKEVISCL